VTSEAGRSKEQAPHQVAGLSVVGEKELEYLKVLEDLYLARNNKLASRNTGRNLCVIITSYGSLI
jgi:hypothetical protein